MISFFNKNKNNEVVELTVSNRTVFRVLLATILSLMLFGAMQKAVNAFVLIGSGFFLALALNAPVQWIASRLPGKKKGSRSIATTISFLIVVIILIGFFASIIPPLVRQTSNFLNEAPDLLQSARSEDNSLGRFIRRYNLESQVNNLSTELSDRLGNVTETAFSTISTIGNSIFSTLTILVLAFMMLIEGPRWLAYFRNQMPIKHRKHADKLAGDMYGVVRGYVNGQVTLAALAALFILVPLFILDISYPIALMVLVFFSGLIPMVGHFIGATIVTIVALFQSLPSAIFILLYYLTYQQIENYAVQPKVQANSTNLTPLIVFTSVIVGVSFGGIFAGLVAIPVAGCIRVLIVDYLERHKDSSVTTT